MKNSKTTSEQKGGFRYSVGFGRHGYWSNNTGPDAVHKRLFGRKGERGWEIAVSLHAFGVSSSTNSLERDNRTFREELNVTNESLGISSRKKPHLLVFADALFSVMLKNDSLSVAAETFENIPIIKPSELTNASNFALEPIQTLCHVNDGLFACNQRSKTGESADIDKTTALKVIQLWDTGPRTYNDVKLMGRVRFITPYSCFPDEEFAAHQWAYQQIGVRNKLRAEGVQLPMLYDPKKEQMQQKKRGRTRDHKRRKGRMFKGYWQRNKTPTLKTIRAVQSHKEQQLQQRPVCPICRRECKSNAGLLIHFRSHTKNGAKSK